MFGIKATYFYYAGTYNAPSDGFLKEPRSYPKDSGIVKFRTFNDALDYLQSRYGKMELVKGKATFSKKGRYVTNHGEYSRPMYTITKISK